MGAKVCYLGDTGLPGPASYLAGIMLHYGIVFDYVPSHQSPASSLGSESYALYVISDYPSARFGEATMSRLADQVHHGAGLLMIGGWESFFGQSGQYHASLLAEALPVLMQSSDDRRNCAQPCLMNKTADHPVLEGLPWDRPPGIGGLNLVAAKPDAQTLLSCVSFVVQREESGYRFDRGQELPLLIIGQFGRGRTAALATDVAPHWVGGFVDWGDQRVVQEVAGECIEVGNWYARFFRNLLAWTGKLDD